MRPELLFGLNEEDTKTARRIVDATEDDVLEGPSWSRSTYGDHLSTVWTCLDCGDQYPAEDDDAFLAYVREHEWVNGFV